LEERVLSGDLNDQTAKINRFFNLFLLQNVLCYFSKYFVGLELTCVACRSGM